LYYGNQIKNLWHLNPEVTFLNNGSFGASPKVVLEAYNDWNRRLEEQPLQFLLDEYPALINSAADKLGNFLGAKGDDIVFIENATTAVNSVIRSLTGFNEKDEILITNHVYPAVRNAMHYISEISGVKINEIEIPFPIVSNEQIIEIVSKNLKNNTKLALFDHISSPTGVIFPVKELTNICKQNGTLVFIDGAHAPGMIDLDIESIGADFYTGNCHKWLFAPKSCAFLWCKPELQESIHPLVISLFYKNGFKEEFNWTGTKNPAPWLSIGAALDFYEKYGNLNIRNYNHNLTIEARDLLLDGAMPPTHDNMLGSMATLPLECNYTPNHESTLLIRKKLLSEYHIEIPIMNFNNRLWYRISCQIFNELKEYEKLKEALKKI
jgi:isopenicillin-N epimerase